MLLAGLEGQRRSFPLLEELAGAGNATGNAPAPWQQPPPASAAAAAVAAFLGYLYLGAVPPAAMAGGSTAQSLLEAADAYLLPDLKAAAEAHLAASCVHEGSVAGLLELARARGAPRLLNRCVTFAAVMADKRRSAAAGAPAPAIAKAPAAALDASAAAVAATAASSAVPAAASARPPPISPWGKKRPAGAPCEPSTPA